MGAVTIARHFVVARPGDRLADAGRGCQAGAGIHAAQRRIRQVRRQVPRTQHGEATGRDGGELARVGDHRYGQHCTRQRRGAAHDLHVAHDKPARHGALAKRHRDDLGADAAGIAHRDGERTQGVIQAGLSTSMN